MTFILKTAAVIGNDNVTKKCGIFNLVPKREHVFANDFENVKTNQFFCFLDDQRLAK